jgi:hypothetical protein
MDIPIELNSWLSESQIRAIEKEKNAKYICDNPLKLRNGQYANFPIAIFYAKEKHPEGSNWFALYTDTLGRIMISNAAEVDNRIISGLLVGKKIIYSSYRHDLNCFENCCIDGGIDYLKVNGSCPAVQLIITKDGLRRV